MEISNTNLGESGNISTGFKKMQEIWKTQGSTFKKYRGPVLLTMAAKKWKKNAVRRIFRKAQLYILVSGYISDSLALSQIENGQGSRFASLCHQVTCCLFPVF